MTEAGIVHLINPDVESGNITSKLVEPPSEDLDISRIYRSRSDSVPVSSAVQSLCFKFILSLFILAFGSPFIICDLYYAYTDTTCVHNPTKKLDIDMYQYLLISGYYGVAFLGSIVLAIFTLKPAGLDAKISDCVKVFAILFKYLPLLFGTAWVIVGSIIFWYEIDNATCSKPVYNYLTASLVLKIISVFFVWKEQSNKK